MCRVGQHWDASVSLNRDEILDAAIELLELGPHALTMRALAERLEVSATALYYWFPSKAELLDAIAEHVFAGIVDVDQDNASWRLRLRSLSSSIVDAAEHHPVAFAWVLMNYSTQPPLTRIDEAMLDVLLKAGFDVRESMLTKNTIWRFLLGHLGLLRLHGHLEPDAAEFWSYPRVPEVAAERGQLTAQDYFDFGLDRVIGRITPSRRSRL
jgi:AcrR family transcriptional regulator